jgi:hypothetical protein
MSTGNLERQIVAFHFWPACENCAHQKMCQIQPKHPAYPHRWHWGKESVSFPEGELILRSWVGTMAIGQLHTGCTSYTVASRYVRPLALHHTEYLHLETEKSTLDAILTRLERKATWGAQDETVYARIFPRYKAVMERQATLRSTSVEALPVAVNA